MCSDTCTQLDNIYTFPIKHSKHAPDTKYSSLAHPIKQLQDNDPHGLDKGWSFLDTPVSLKTPRALSSMLSLQIPQQRLQRTSTSMSPMQSFSTPPSTRCHVRFLYTFSANIPGVGDCNLHMVHPVSTNAINPTCTNKSIECFGVYNFRLCTPYTRRGSKLVSIGLGWGEEIYRHLRGNVFIEMVLHTWNTLPEEVIEATQQQHHLKDIWKGCRSNAGNLGLAYMGPWPAWISWAKGSVSTLRNYDISEW